MEFRKLTPNGGCITLSLPKEDLEERGIVDKSGELQGEHWAKIQENTEGAYRVELVSP